MAAAGAMGGLKQARERRGEPLGVWRSWQWALLLAGVSIGPASLEKSYGYVRMLITLIQQFHIQEWFLHVCTEVHACMRCDQTTRGMFKLKKCITVKDTLPLILLKYSPFSLNTFIPLFLPLPEAVLS